MDGGFAPAGQCAAIRNVLRAEQPEFSQITTDWRAGAVGALALARDPADGHGQEIRMANSTRSDVSQLNSFLRGERAAVATYGQCIEKLQKTTLVQALADLQHSHMERVRKLSERVGALGGTPDEGSSIWVGLTKLLEGGASAFGERTALAALEEGEQYGTLDYRRHLDDLAPETRQFIASVVLPEQQRTQNLLNELRQQL